MATDLLLVLHEELSQLLGFKGFPQSQSTESRQSAPAILAIETGHDHYEEAL